MQLFSFAEFLSWFMFKIKGGKREALFYSGMHLWDSLQKSCVVFQMERKGKGKRKNELLLLQQ